MTRAVYIVIFIGFFRRLLRKMLAPAGKRPAASRDIPGASGNIEERALFLVDARSNYYIISETTHEMDEKTSNWLCHEMWREWNDYCKLIPGGLSLHVLGTGSIDRQIYELAVKLDSPARARLNCLVTGARATYNDLWRRGV